MPLTFLTIVGTVLFSSLVAPWAARRLGVSEPNPQGLLIAGANPFARQIAAALKTLGIRSVMIDTNRESIAAARMAGLEARESSALDPDLLDDLDLAGIGRMLALTPNDSVNVLIASRFVKVFDRSEVYQIAPPHSATEGKPADASAHAHILVDREFTWRKAAAMLDAGYALRSTMITAAFTMEHFRAMHGQDAVAIMTYSENSKRLTLLTEDARSEIKPGQTVIALTPVAKSKTA